MLNMVSLWCYIWQSTVFSTFHAMVALHVHLFLIFTCKHFLRFDWMKQVTLRRTWGKMPLWHKIKLLYSLLFQAVFLPSPEELNKMVNFLILLVCHQSICFLYIWSYENKNPYDAIYFVFFFTFSWRTWMMLTCWPLWFKKWARNSLL